MKKVFDQTVRDLKREVNKKVLKVPGIEQKVLDATSNEPWGPHGSLLADIAMASSNYHEYQMIMAVIWKRINDIGKNWRHVYKGLTVLDYLVAHGSERVIDDIREHAYQISTLSDFQYIDSSGRDQGSNVRKKSQNLVALVNDKERIIEVRQKAAANRDKYRNSSMGAMYRPGSGGYGDKYDYDRYEGRYGSRDEDKSGYSNGRERDYGYRDDERRYGDSYNRDGDRYGRDYEDRYGRDGYRDDDYRGRSRGGEEYQSGPRSRSSDRYRNCDDDGHLSARGSGARADDQFSDGSRHERRFSEQNIDAPPSYEEAVSDSRSPIHSERNGENSVAAAPRTASPHASNNASQATSAPDASSPVTKEGEAFDEFDPRSSTSATPMTSAAPTAIPVASASPEFDLLALAIVPASPSTGEIDAHPNSATVHTFASSQPATNVGNQPFDDPFGDGPFRAEQTSASIPPFQPSMNQNGQMPHVSGVHPSSTNSQFQTQETTSSNLETDILADLFPPGPSDTGASETAFSAPTGQPSQQGNNMFGQPAQPGLNMYGQSAQQDSAMYAQPAQSTANLYGQPGQQAHCSHPGANVYGQQPYSSANAYGHQAQPSANPYGQQPQPSAGPYAQPGQSVVNPYGQLGQPNLNNSSGSFNTQPGAIVPFASNAALHPSSGPSAAPVASSSSGALAIVPQVPKEKFEPKSAVWADTLSRGLVNLNISGHKTNPLADIGVDFEAINRKEKRFEKPAANTVTSTVTMGKAMGSGSGMGRAGANALRAAPNPMMGSGMGMGGGPGAGMGMGGYGGMNQRPLGMGIGMNMSMNNGMGMGQGAHFQQQTGMPQGSMSGNYNTMTGSGGYVPQQQPYGGGYR